MEKQRNGNVEREGKGKFFAKSIIIASVASYLLFGDIAYSEYAMFKIPKMHRPNIRRVYDVNLDGTDDIITSDGTVFITQKDGTHKLFDSDIDKLGLIRAFDGNYYSAESVSKKKFGSKLPFVYEEGDFNSDGIKDRKISWMGMEQVQYGIRDSVSGDLEYLTQGQLIERARENCRASEKSLLEKYTLKGGSE
jgi:hypothetical protein